MRRGEDVDEDARLAEVEVRPWWRARARGRGGTVERLRCSTRPCGVQEGRRRAGGQGGAPLLTGKEQLGDGEVMAMVQLVREYGDAARARPAASSIGRRGGRGVGAAPARGVQRLRWSGGADRLGDEGGRGEQLGEALRRGRE